ncbi:PP2A regulatory subunit TAP46 [Dichanthelium oligosanthes]|uniref:PP2A regulatory subunit TAP46 n=1 Tax=Dichanthelium oligosanthes TaxID=888268 RepID=A0A1E5WL26_9POAL|nr:PP2A regulatory subunit TAP46 [Dichanthelium oligosanthes]
MAEVEEVGNRMQSQMRLHPESDDDDADLPLPALFDRASRLHGLASSSALDQEGIRKGVELLRRCDEMVSKLGLFSPNETKEDVSTANLKYLLVPYYLGEMTEKIAQEDRIPILKSSQDHLKEFIALCEVLELIPEDELELSRQRQPDTMANRRAQKVRPKAAVLSAPVEAGEEDALEDDGEEEREAWLATISLALCKAFDLLDMLKKEEEMLLAVKERQEKDGNAFAREMLDERTKKAEAWHHNAANRAPYSKPADPITCATFAQDVIEGRASVSQAHEHKHQPLIFGPASLVGGGLTSERERMAAQVFQPGYSLCIWCCGLYSLRHMDVSELFYPSTAQALEAEARAETEKQNISKKIATLGRLPRPSIHYQPFTPAVNRYSSTSAFALFGDRNNIKILCWDAAGNTSVYDAASHSLTAMPELNSPKGYSCVAAPISIPGAAAAHHAMSDDDHTNCLYMMDMNPGRSCSFEVLAYDPVEHWCWDPLPPPPFLEDPEYEAPLGAPFAVVGGGTRICVSTTTATYCFDTVTDAWNKVGDWVLPFRAEYVPELGLCLGLASDDGGPYDLCTLDDLSTDAGSSPPTVCHIGEEFELPENWWEVTSDLVSLGSRRFCIVSSFMVDNDEYDWVPVTVFTGVEVLPGERGLRMVKHKSECFIAFFRFVLRGHRSTFTHAFISREE